MDSLNNITSLSQTGYQSPKQDDEKPYSSKSTPLGPGLRKTGFHESREATACNIPSPEKKLQQLPSQVTIVKGVSRIEPQSLSGAVCQDNSFFPDDKQKITFPLSLKREQSTEQTPKPPLKPLSYTEKHKVVRSPESTRQLVQSRVREYLSKHDSHIRINEAIQRGYWLPPVLEELIPPTKKDFSQTVNVYHKHLHKTLKGIADPIERCIRVTSCIKYLDEMLSPKDNHHFKKLRVRSQFAM